LGPAADSTVRSGAVQVQDVMTQATITESATDSLRSAAVNMWRQQTGSLLITEGGQLVGIITERDLLRAVALGADPSMRDVTGIFAAMSPGRINVEHEFDQLVRERRFARIEHGDLD
jgi:CBS domain-containing protein